MYNPIPNHNFLHSCYVSARNNAAGIDAVVAAVKDVDTLESRLQVIQNPMMRVWVAKKGARNYEFKRECVQMSQLDMYVCEYKQMGETLAKALGKSTYGYINTRKLLESPYVYGGDIDIEVLVKLEYLANSRKAITDYNIGVMDIETSVLGDNQIILNGYCDWKTKSVYCYILEEWYQPTDNWLEGMMKRWHQELDATYQKLNDKAKKVFHPEEWTPHFIMCKNEAELITKSVRCGVMHKPDFMLAWNDAYELNWIPERAAFRGLDVVDLFSHPDVPPEFRMFNFKEDKRKTEHLADKWHILNCPGYTFWVDPMCLFGRLRKVKGREVMYTLDYICGKILGAGKVKFGQNATHYMMQTKDKTGYCVYNCFDVIMPNILDHVTSDISSMLMLTGPSLLQDFAHQTVQLKAQFYEYCLSKNAVSGTVSGSLRRDYDGIIGNVGGAVLNPSLMRYLGSKSILESDDPTGIYRLCCDLDVTSFYPSITIAFNISKETKEATILWITGCPYSLEHLREMQIEISGMAPGKEKEKKEEELEAKAVKNAEYIFAFCSSYPTVIENAVSLCKHHFNIPGYDEMLDLFTKEYNIDLQLNTVDVRNPMLDASVKIERGTSDILSGEVSLVGTPRISSLDQE